MQVGDILRKKAARVATVRMNETVAIAAQLMRSSNISALVVKDVVRTEGNTAVGMFTERDVVRAIAEHGAAGVNMRVSQFISVQQLVSCTSTDTLEHVRHLMSKHHIRHLPVIDNYSLIGVSAFAISQPRSTTKQRPSTWPPRPDRSLRTAPAFLGVALPGKTVSHRKIRLNSCRKPGARKSAPEWWRRKTSSVGGRMARNILILGASYGSLLATKLLMAGHNVTLVCRKQTAELINRDGTEVRIKLRDEAAHRPIFSRDLPGILDAVEPADVDPSRYDLVCLAMQEPQYTDHAIRLLIIKIADAKLPCLSIMNMPPLPYLKRIPALAKMELEEAYTNARGTGML